LLFPCYYNAIYSVMHKANYILSCFSHIRLEVMSCFFMLSTETSIQFNLFGIPKPYHYDMPQRWKIERCVLLNPFVLEPEYHNTKGNLFLGLYQISNVG
jgi:hypothetical protein